MPSLDSSRPRRGSMRILAPLPPGSAAVSVCLAGLGGGVCSLAGLGGGVCLLLAGLGGGVGTSLLNWTVGRF